MSLHVICSGALACQTADEALEQATYPTRHVIPPGTVYRRGRTEMSSLKSMRASVACCMCRFFTSSPRSRASVGRSLGVSRWLSNCANCATVIRGSPLPSTLPCFSMIRAASSRASADGCSASDSRSFNAARVVMVPSRANATSVAESSPRFSRSISRNARCALVYRMLNASRRRPTETPRSSVGQARFSANARMRRHVFTRHGALHAGQLVGTCGRERLGCRQKCWCGLSKRLIALAAGTSSTMRATRNLSARRELQCTNRVVRQERDSECSGRTEGVRELAGGSRVQRDA